MLKFKLYYDKDAEEDWLKEMCLNGWAFKKFFLGFYTFEKCEPGEYNYQIDLLDSWSGEKDDYAAFMEKPQCFRILRQEEKQKLKCFLKQ